MTPRAREFTYYLGTGRLKWLWSGLNPNPLMVSRRTLAEPRTLRRAVVPYSIDSAGYSEFELFGTWTLTSLTFAREVYEWSEILGPPDFVGTQDWLCTMEALHKTGLPVSEHQARTTGSFIDLMSCDSEIPWLPILQGVTGGDYLAHANQFYKCGIELHRLPLVGIGSIAHKQDRRDVVHAVRELHRAGLSLHGFGMKKKGVAHLQPYLSSADSMSWSYEAALEARAPAHVRPEACAHLKSCNNCLHFALRWLDQVKALYPSAGREQMPIWSEAAQQDIEDNERRALASFLQEQGVAINDPLLEEISRTITTLTVAHAMADGQIAPVRYYTGADATTYRRPQGAGASATLPEITTNLTIMRLVREYLECRSLAAA